MPRSAQNKFIIFGQSRSGSTLLTKILSTHPDIFCDGELLRHDSDPRARPWHRWMPLPLMRRARHDSAANTYGFKLLFYHVALPRLYMRVFHLLGWRFIHLYRRSIADQALSTIVAHRTGHFHRTSEAEVNDQLDVEPQRLERVLERRAHWHEREKTLISAVPHVAVSYEDDLESAENWQAAVDRVADFLGLAHHPVGEVGLRRMAHEPYAKRIRNFDELEPILRRAGYST